MSVFSGLLKNGTNMFTNQMKENIGKLKDEAQNMVNNKTGEVMGKLQNIGTPDVKHATGQNMPTTNDENSATIVPLSAPQEPIKVSSPPVNESPSPLASTSKDIVGDLNHSIFSEEEINILKLMQINHLTPDIGEDVVNGDILGVLTTALNNQLSTKDAESIIKKIIIERIPKIAEKIADVDNNTLAELIFKKTKDSINFRKHLTQALQEVSTPGRIITSLELVDILIKHILSSFENKQEINKQTGGGIGNAYPFKSRLNSKTRVRPKRRVKIV